MNGIDLKEAAKHLDSLPAMPGIAQKLLALNLDSIAGEKSLLKLIEQDPQIAAKIVGLANSPLFGSSKRVTGVQDASILLGLTRVKSVTLGIAVMTALVRRPSGLLDVQKLWMHSLYISLALRVIALAMPRNTRPLDDEIFLAGLLHDIGFLVLNHLDRSRSDELHQKLAADTTRSSFEIENELLEINHCELGAELAAYWDLPEHIVAVIRYHHTPEEELAAVGQPLVSMLNIAEKLIGEYGFGGELTTEIDPEEWRSLGIDPARQDELVEKIKTQVDAASASPLTLG